MTATAGTDLRSKVFCYRDRSAVVQSGLARYFNQRTFSDLTVVAPNGQKVLCHQVVLSAGSRRFADMLEQGPLSGEELPVRGVDSAGLEALLRFFYTGEVSLTYLNIIPVYDAAQRLDVPGVSAACKTFSEELIASTSTVCSVLQQALQFQLHDTVAACFESVRERFADVIADDDFLSTSFATLMRILNDNAAHCPKQLVFGAAWRWGWSDLQHLQLLPEILNIIKVPHDTGLSELQKLPPPPARRSSSGAAATPPTPPGGATMAQLHAAVLEQVVQGTDFAVAIKTVVDEQLALAAAAGLAPPGLPGTAGPSANNAAPAAGGTTSPAGPTSDPLGSTPRQPLPGNVVEFDPAVAAAAAAAVAAAGGGNLPGLPSLQAALPGQLHGQSYNAAVGQLLQQAMLGGNMNGLPLGMLQGQQQDGAAGNGGVMLGLDTPNGVPRGVLPPQPQLQLPPSAHQAMPGGFSLAQASQIMMSNPQLVHLFAATAAQRGIGDDVQTQLQHFLEASTSGRGAGVVGPNLSSLVLAAAAGGPQRGGARLVGASPGHGGKGSGAKGVCQVESCFADLTGLRDYHLRYKICEDHLKASSIVKDGVQQRFCQQCGRFHHLEEFDSDKRSCRARLQKHNARRRKRYMGENGGNVEAGTNDSGGEDGGNSPNSSAHMAKRMRDMGLVQRSAGPVTVGGSNGGNGNGSGIGGPVPTSSGGRGRVTASGVAASGGGVTSAGSMGGPNSTAANNHAIFMALDVLANVAHAGAAQEAAAQEAAAGRDGLSGIAGVDAAHSAAALSLAQHQATYALLGYPPMTAQQAQQFLSQATQVQQQQHQHQQQSALSIAPIGLAPGFHFSAEQLQNGGLGMSMLPVSGQVAGAVPAPASSASTASGSRAEAAAQRRGSSTGDGPSVGPQAAVDATNHQIDEARPASTQQPDVAAEAQPLQHDTAEQPAEVADEAGAPQ